MKRFSFRTLRSLSKSPSSVKGRLNNPYRGLGSGTKRALVEWDKIDFDNDESGNLFIATIHRKSSGESSIEHFSKTTGKIVQAILKNPNVTIPELSKSSGLTERAIEKQLKALRESGTIRRIGPAKGGHWEVISPSVDQ